MSLITRCPACGTMFKVVPDQLKVSQGWVRCGHCADVFDASQHLQQAAPARSPVPAPMPGPAISPAPAQTLAPPSPVSAPHWPDQTAAPGPHRGGDTADVDLDALQGASVWPPSQPPQEPAPVPGPAVPDAYWSPGAFLAERTRTPNFAESTVARPGQPTDFDPAAWRRQLSESTPAPAVAPPAGGETGRKSGPVAKQEKPSASARPDAAARQGPVSVSFQTAGDSVYPDELEHAFDDEEPANVRNDVSFVRQARRKAFWRRPAVMAASGALGLLLLAALLLQVAFFQRDAIAAASPAAVPWLQQMCARLGCEVGPLKRIDAVVIDSSSFSRLGPDAFRLNFAIKNSGASALAMPALEVTLTDTQERAVVRRVLTPSQFGAAAATLPAGGEFAGSVAMKVPADTSAPDGAPLRVAGYRVLAFYP